MLPAEAITTAASSTPGIAITWAESFINATESW